MMAKYKSKPTFPTAEAVEQFAAGAKRKSIDPPETAKYPWEKMDPKAKPTNGINLRLNDYELELIRYLARVQDRSIQKTLKRVLIPALKEEIERYHAGTGMEPY